MEFGLSGEQKDLVGVFREFGERTFTTEQVAQWCRDGGLPDAVVAEFAELYFSTLGQAEVDTFSNSVMNQALILEELSRCAGATLPFQNELFNLQIMGGFAGRKTFSRILDDYRKTGRLMFSMGVSEPHAGSDTMNMRTNTQTIGGTIYLNGAKTYVNNGEYAPNILVAAIDRMLNRKNIHPWHFGSSPAICRVLPRCPSTRWARRCCRSLRLSSRM